MKKIIILAAGLFLILALASCATSPGLVSPKSPYGDLVIPSENIVIVTMDGQTIFIPKGYLSQGECGWITKRAYDEADDMNEVMEKAWNNEDCRKLFEKLKEEMKKKREMEQEERIGI